MGFNVQRALSRGFIVGLVLTTLAVDSPASHATEPVRQVVGSVAASEVTEPGAPDVGEVSAADGFPRTAMCSTEDWVHHRAVLDAESACDPTVVRLAQALDQRLTVWKRPDGTPIHVAYCRDVRKGCRARLASFAQMLTKAANDEGLDPFLLAAVAVKESGLSPTAVGPKGSAGILQLNPRGVGAGLRVVRDPHYRAWCARHRVDGCQSEVIERGARHLASWIESCGDVAAALGGYNSGECGATDYSWRVLREERRLRDLAAGIAPGGEAPTAPRPDQGVSGPVA